MVKKCYRWLAILIVTGLISCYPNGADVIQELDLVATNYDNTFDFKAHHTYAIPDSVIFISGALLDSSQRTKPDFVSATYAIPITNSIKQNMGNYGWTEVDKTQNPDVLILPSAISTTYLYYYYDWWYWGWYYPYYPYWGWGWYYPYYPAYSVGSYTVGSVFVQMVEAASLHPGQGSQAHVVWTGIFNGLLEGSTSSIISRAQTNITAAFTQSPYLNIK